MRAILTPDKVMKRGEDKLLMTMLQRPAVHLTQRRDDNVPKVRDRTPARGKNWIPPLSQKRADGPLEPPEFDHDDEPDGSDAGESGRAPWGTG